MAEKTAQITLAKIDELEKAIDLTVGNRSLKGASLQANFTINRILRDLRDQLK